MSGAQGTGGGEGDATALALVAGLRALAPDRRAAVIAGLEPRMVQRLSDAFPGFAHAGQRVPPGDWRVWVMMAGRGFGKTRTGAEWVSELARSNPGLRIALVAATLDEARTVMVEGESGLLQVARPRERRDMRWHPSVGRLTFASGAQAELFSGANPAGLRGPEHGIAWCDELAKWRHGEETWTNLQLGLRGARRPRVLVTTTPAAGSALSAILAEPGVVLTGGATRMNPHLPPAFRATVERLYGGTRLGRQELDGELIEDVEGTLWPAALIAARRCEPVRPEALARVVVGVDPPASAGGTCGIVVAGVARAGEPRVLVVDDRSIAGASPEGWARAVAGAAEDWGATRVVVEANQGGDMAIAVLRGADARLPVQAVHASRGKSARAEPVAGAFERGDAAFAGHFAALEAELAGLVAGGGYRGPGNSPDRADAMVWAMAALLEPVRGSARVRGL